MYSSSGCSVLCEKQTLEHSRVTRKPRLPSLAHYEVPCFVPSATFSLIPEHCSHRKDCSRHPGTSYVS